ncbi:HlyD family efflux transporter periplasmic adaptor subunit [Parasphingorhabdus sp.]|uniref:HlyD family efflux transporter periplasmic adaptor subunit n=1 Tax=Parasphingorhabdus sp. TaxID=2709688 RepID=UPI003D2CFF34
MADNPNPNMEEDLGKAAASSPPETRKSGLKGGLRWIVMLSVPLAILIFGVYYYITSGRYVSTENAYVKQDIVSISPEIGGKIVEVNVQENDYVRAGDLLFRIDPAPFALAVSQADADIAAAQVTVQNLQTDYDTSGVDIAAARSDIALAQANFERQAALMERGFATKADYQAAQHEVEQAQAKLQVAQASVVSARSRLASGTAVPGQNPDVARAQVAKEQALLDLSRTDVRAPVSGRIAQASRLQTGQMMMAGLPVVSLVDNENSWIEANFKETDLAKMAVGQKATVTFDAYPGVTLNGRVESIGSGTGSEFSVLPAQNANGNWVKVTQRVPVKIQILDKSPRQLIAGISAEVTIDLHTTGT